MNTAIYFTERKGGAASSPVRRLPSQKGATRQVPTMNRDVRPESGWAHDHHRAEPVVASAGPGEVGLPQREQAKSKT
jgi:hypothetical protein